MGTTQKLSREEMIRRFETPDYDAFDGRDERVAAGKPIVVTGTQPISIRLSRPLLEALDGIADTQHRKRSNLIQHILWEYIHKHGDRK